jgi:hypothetical protein
MNYSLYIMVLKEMVSMESKVQSGAVVAVSPLLSSQSIHIVYFVFLRCLVARSHGVPFIVGFRSRQFDRGEVYRKWAPPRGQETWPA